MKKEEVKLGSKVRVINTEHVKAGMIGEVQELDLDFNHNGYALVLVKIKNFSKGHGPEYNNWWFVPQQLEPVEDA